MPAWGGWKSDNSSQFAKTFSTRSFYGGEASGLGESGIPRHDLVLTASFDVADAGRSSILAQLATLAEQVQSHTLHAKLSDLRPLFYRCAAHLVKADVVSFTVDFVNQISKLIFFFGQPDVEILHQMIFLPILIFDEGAVALGQEVWTWVVDARPELETRIMVEVSEAWSLTVREQKGLFSSKFG